MVHAKSATKYRPVISEWTPGHANPRGEVVAVRRAQSARWKTGVLGRHDFDAGGKNRADIPSQNQRVRHHQVPGGRVEVEHPVVAVGKRVVPLVTNSEVQRQV